jgi:hypothetical protein
MEETHKKQLSFDPTLNLTWTQQLTRTLWKNLSSRPNQNLFKHLRHEIDAYKEYKVFVLSSAFLMISPTGTLFSIAL